MDVASAGGPITFFQPQSNAGELLQVFSAMNTLADEASGMPRYMGGSSQNGGGATRTASGLSMLMQNAEKVLQAVAANVDDDVVDPALTALYDMIVLTDQTRMLTGEESVRVRGVNVAVQKDSERAKQLQFLQITANPLDAGIVGELGRARVLRAIAQGMGLPDDIVPDDQQIQAKLEAEKQQQAMATAIAQPGQPAQHPPGAHRPGPPGGQGAPAGAPGAPGAPAEQAQQAQGEQAPVPGPQTQGGGPPTMNSFQTPPSS
jgi:hypothetical protein